MLTECTMLQEPVCTTGRASINLYYAQQVSPEYLQHCGTELILLGHDDTTLILLEN